MTRISAAVFLVWASVGRAVFAESLTIRPGLWKTVQSSSQPSSPGDPTTEPPASASPPICINDGDALVREAKGSVLGDLPGRSSIVHVVEDRVKRVIAIHDAKLQTLRMNIAAPWSRMRASGDSGLFGLRTVLKGDFARRLQREVAHQSWSISPEGTQKAVSFGFTQVMERIGDCPPGISADPIVWLSEPEAPTRP